MLVNETHFGIHVLLYSITSDISKNSGLYVALTEPYHLTIYMIAVMAAGLPWDSRIDASALFTYPSIWALLNPLSASCVNAPEDTDGEPQECSSGELDTGVVCEAAACGLPAEWPEGQPYYLPVDLQVCCVYAVQH